MLNDVKNLTSLTMEKFRPLSMILRLRHACLLISQIQIRVPVIGIEIEYVPVNYPPPKGGGLVTDP